MARDSLKLSADMDLEDICVGQEIISESRTIAEADIAQFASLSGDFSPIHVDADISQKSPAGQRIAHGLLITSIASGLAVQSGILNNRPIYFREIEGLKFIRPVLIGDTIHVRFSVSEKKAIPKLGGALIKINLEVFNQDQSLVQRGRLVVWTAAQFAG